MAQKNRKSQVKSFSLDVLTVRNLESILESHFANQLGASDFVAHCINEKCAEIKFAAQHEVEMPMPHSLHGNAAGVMVG